MFHPAFNLSVLNSRSARSLYLIALFVFWDVSSLLGTTVNRKLVPARSSS